MAGNWYNELGRHGRALDTPLGRVGFLICNDRWSGSGLGRAVVAENSYCTCSRIWYKVVEQ